MGEVRPLYRCEAVFAVFVPRIDDRPMLPDRNLLFTNRYPFCTRCNVPWFIFIEG